MHCSVRCFYAQDGKGTLACLPRKASRETHESTRLVSSSASSAIACCSLIACHWTPRTRAYECSSNSGDRRASVDRQRERERERGMERRDTPADRVTPDSSVSRSRAIKREVTLQEVQETKWRVDHASSGSLVMRSPCAHQRLDDSCQLLSRCYRLSPQVASESRDLGIRGS